MAEGASASSSTVGLESGPQYQTIIASQIVAGSSTRSTPNHDEAIQAQEKAIEKEIAESIPLIDVRKPLEALQSEYSSDDKVYQEKLKDLLKQYSFMRRTRPDGNCFYRGFAFSYMESLLNDPVELKRFTGVAASSKDLLISLGFPQFTIEDFHDTFMEVLKRIEINPTLEELLSIFNDQGYSDYVVVYLRLLTSGQLQSEADFFSAFVEGGRTISEFCKQEVEPMYKESDHLHVTALTRHIGTAARVVYLDRGSGTGVNTHDFYPDPSYYDNADTDGDNSNCATSQAQRQPRVHLLYRPGHYDVLYKE